MNKSMFGEFNGKGVASRGDCMAWHFTEQAAGSTISLALTFNANSSLTQRRNSFFEGRTGQRGRKYDRRCLKDTSEIQTFIKRFLCY